MPLYPYAPPQTLNNSIGGNVSLNNTSNYFDGPSIAQGSAGTWWVSGQICVTSTTVDAIYAKLWDGTTVIDSAVVTVPANGEAMVIHLSGYITNPVGNLRISAKDPSTVNGVVVANTSGNGADSTISAFRIK